MRDMNGFVAVPPDSAVRCGTNGGDRGDILPRCDGDRHWVIEGRVNPHERRSGTQHPKLAIFRNREPAHAANRTIRIVPNFPTMIRVIPHRESGIRADPKPAARIAHNGEDERIRQATIVNPAGPLA